MNDPLYVVWPFSQIVVERIGWVLVHSLWQFALVALLAGVLVRAMRRSSAGMRYGVLVVAMTASVATPATTWMLLPGDVPAPVENIAPDPVFTAAIDPEPDATRRASDAMLASEAAIELPTPVPAAPSVATKTRTVLSPEPAAIIETVPSWSERAKMLLRPWLAWIVAVWSIGVFVWSTRPLLGWYTLRRLRRVGVSTVSDEVLGAMQRVSKRLGLPGAVRLLQSTLAQVPIVVGYFRPVILLPVSLLASIPAAQLEAILAHELAHVRRHDFAVNLLQTLVETLFFYHPAVWWLSHRVRVEREHCCDDLVVTLFNNRVEYGRALLAIEEQRGRRTVLALGATDGLLLARVRRIAGLDTDLAAGRWPVTSFVVACLVVAGIALTTLFAQSVIPKPLNADTAAAAENLNTADSAERTGVVPSGEWPMWGGSSHRNHVASGQLPTEWDLKTGRNVVWKATIGTQTCASPVVSGGKVFIGTNNGAGLDPRRPSDQDFSCLVCFDEVTGKLLWQYASDKMPAGRTYDWPGIGLCSTACVVGDRLWVVTNRCEVLCLDTEGFRDGENDGPIVGETERTEFDADVVWKFDMFNALGVRPLHQAVSSPAVVDGIVLLNTSNSPDQSRQFVPTPQAPHFMALDAATGRVVWQDNSSGESIIVGGSSCGCSGTSPAVATIDGVTQAIFAGREGWLYGFDFADLKQGKTKRLWQFDCNPKASIYMRGGRSTRNTLVASPVVVGNQVFIATGRDPEQGEGPGDLWCIDATKRGDISSELVFNKSYRDGREPIPHKPLRACDPKQGDFTRPNPNSGAVWHYVGTDRNGDGKLAFDESFHRSISSPAIHDGLLFIPDFSGLLHCVDVSTGKGLWTHDLLAPVWSSCVIADGYVLIGDEDGDLEIFKVARTGQSIYDDDPPNLGTSIYPTPAVGSDTLFVATKDMLIAIRDEAALQDTRAGRESRDAGLDPTAGLAKSDNVQKPAEDANGDLRSNSAARSGEPRRGQVAELPNGIKVELVGLALMESDPKIWWRPDGSRVADVPVHDKGAITTSSHEMRRVLLRVHGLPNYLDVTTPGMTSTRWDEAHGSGGPFVRVDGGYAIQPNQKTAKIEVCIATQPQSALRVLDPSGVKLPRPANASADPLVEDIEVEIVNSVKSVNTRRDEGTWITWISPVEGDRPIDLDLKLIDKDGNTHDRKQIHTNGHATLRQHVTYEFDVPFARVARFEYRLRMFHHSVTFENVSLHVGEMTEVKMRTTSLPESQAASVGRKSPNPAIVSTDTPPKLDDETNKTNNANGEPRSKPAVRPGGPRPAHVCAAELPDGLCIELHGLVNSDPNAPVAWMPDGTTINRPKEWPELFSATNQNPTHGFVFRITGLAKGQSVAWRPPGQWFGPNLHEKVPDLISVSTRYPGAKSADVKVCISNAEWGPWQPVETDGSIKQRVEVAAPFRDSYDLVKVNVHAGSTGMLRTGLELEGIQGIDDQTEYEAVVVDQQGTRHERRGVGVSKQGTIPYFSQPVKQIDHLEYRLRPYRHWVTFKNVSLEPGRKTEVLVSTKSLPDEQANNEKTGNDNALRVAERAAEVAKAEYEKLLESNRKVPGSVPEIEIERVRLQRDAALRQVHEAKLRLAGNAKEFQGHWAVDSCESEAPMLKVSDCDARRWRWTIKGDEITWGREGQEWKVNFKIDPTQTPKQIDLSFVNGPFKGEERLGIYDSIGDDAKKLRIMVQDPGSRAGRPTSFARKAGSLTSLITLHPIPPVDPKQELASFQGTWSFDVLQFRIWPEPIGIGIDGKGRKSEKRWVVKGNQITWTSQEGEEIRVAFTIDPFKAPKQIDFTFLNGPNRGAKSLGIYEPKRGNDDSLWLCMTNPGTDAPRPTDVSYATGEPRSMIGIHRVAPPAKQSAAKALKRFHGEWQMTLCDSTLRTFGGTQQEVSKWQWTIKMDEILWNRQGDVWKLKLEIDPSKNPAEMNLTYLTGPFKGAKCLGMYEWGGVDSQSLMIAIQDPGSDAPRPTRYFMSGDVKTGLMDLRPSKPTDAERLIGAFQGTWTLRNFDTASWPLPGGKGPDKSGEGGELRWTVKAYEITWTDSLGQEIKASFTIDPRKRPKQIDLTFLSGPNKGETCPGIYQRDDLDENILWLCMADPGSKKVRPTNFSYRIGEGRSMLSLYQFEPLTTFTQALPRPVKSPQQLAFQHDSFTFVRLQYSDLRGRPGARGTWATDYPDSDINLTARVATDTGLRVEPKGKVLRLTDSDLKRYPFTYIVEAGSLQLSDAEVQSLRDYLVGGGFLMVDDFWGAPEWQNFYAQLKRVFPDREPRKLPLEHELFHCFYDLQELPQIPSIHVWLSGRRTERDDAPQADYQGVFDDQGRLMVIIGHNTDLGDGWERAGVDERYFREVSQRLAYPMGINIVVYALTQPAR